MDAAQVARAFYEAFARRDWASVGELYAEDARFSDPAFPALDAAGARAMWRMLLTRGTDLEVTWKLLDASADTARVAWRAQYTFTQTGRPVINEITANLTVRNGKIVRHVDEFDFARWARQALGLPGLLLGWSGFLQRKVQTQASAQLARFREKTREAS